MLRPCLSPCELGVAMGSTSPGAVWTAGPWGIPIGCHFCPAWLHAVPAPWGRVQDLGVVQHQIWEKTSEKHWKNQQNHGKNMGTWWSTIKFESNPFYFTLMSKPKLSDLVAIIFLWGVLWRGHIFSPELWVNAIIVSIHTIPITIQRLPMRVFPYVWVAYLLILEGNKRFHYTISGWNATGVLPESFNAQKTFLSFVWWKPGEFTKFSPGFDVHQVFTRLRKFTRFSPGFGNNQVFTKFWEIHPAFYQVLDMYQIFTKFWKFTRFSPSFHQVLQFHQIKPNFTVKRINFTKRKGKNTSFVFLVKIWWLHRVFPKEIHQGVLQVCSRFWNFTKFSPSFHQVFILFTNPSRSIRRFQNRIKSALQWWYVILKVAFLRHHLKGKKHTKRFVRSLEHTERFFGMKRWWIPGKPSVRNFTSVEDQTCQTCGNFIITSSLKHSVLWSGIKHH